MGRRLTLQEKRNLALEIARRHGGELPTPVWLQKHGHHGLVASLKKHPDLFSHIPQKPSKPKGAQWREIALKIAQEQGGELPRVEWLTNNGWVSLSVYMKHNPKLFADIPRKPRKDTPRPLEEAVRFAEDLAKKHDGLLPKPGWLHNHHPWLYTRIRKNREAFAHIPREQPVNI